MKKELLKDLIKKAVKDRNFPGMFCMGLLPKAIEKMNKTKIKLEPTQKLRPLIVEKNDIFYYILLLNAIDNNKYWAIFKLYPKFSDNIITTYDGKWCGYIPFESLIEERNVTYTYDDSGYVIYYKGESIAGVNTINRTEKSPKNIEIHKREAEAFKKSILEGKISADIAKKINGIDGLN